MPTCQACGRQGALWPTTPRVVCCGRPGCRAQLTWGEAQWEGVARMARSRGRVGVELSDMDLHALAVARGDAEVHEVTWPEREKKLTKRQKAKAAKEAKNPRLTLNS